MLENRLARLSLDDLQEYKEMIEEEIKNCSTKGVSFESKLYTLQLVRRVIKFKGHSEV